MIAPQPGDRVVIAMRNYPEWSLAFFAATAIGAVAVPLNAWWTGEELAFGISDSGARVVVALCLAWFGGDCACDRIQCAGSSNCCY